MANTSSRTLRLLSLLQTHRFWAGEELSERLGVSARTLRRDVDRLRVLDDDEAVALSIGLRAAAQGAVVGIEEASVRALAKVARIMPPHLRRRVDALRAVTMPAAWTGGPTVDAGLL